MKKQILFLVMIIAVMGVVSGCVIKNRNEEKLTSAVNQPLVKEQTQLNSTSISTGKLATSTDDIALGNEALDKLNWLSYENDEYGISFKHPKQFNVYKKDFSNDVFSFQIKNLPNEKNYGFSMHDEAESFGGGITFEAEKNSENKNYDDIINDWKSTAENGQCKFTVRDFRENVLLISQCSAHYSGKLDMVGYVIKNNMIYKFGYGWHERKQKNESEDAFFARTERYYKNVFEGFVESLEIQAK